MTPIFVLLNLVPIGRLAREQEGLDELSFATYGKASKSPEPFLLRNLRLGIQPAGQQNDLLPRNVALAHPRVQVGEQRLGQVVAADLRHAPGRRSIRARSAPAT